MRNSMVLNFVHMLTRFSEFEFWWPEMTFVTFHWTLNINNSILLNMVLWHHVFKFFKLLSIKYAVMPVLQMSTFSNLSWPLISTKYIMSLLLNIMHLLNMLSTVSIHAPLLKTVYKLFRVWLLVTLDGLGPPPNTMRCFLSILCIYMPSMKSIHASHLEISC